MNQITEDKEILGLLYNIAFEEEQVIDILNVLETKEEAQRLKIILEKSTDIVLSEVYDILSEITNGRFEQEFVKSRYLKREYLQKRDSESLKKLIAQLQIEGYIC